MIQDATLGATRHSVVDFDERNIGAVKTDNHRNGRSIPSSS